jgi:hypothetical protein
MDIWHTLNANIPPIYCKISKEYLYDYGSALNIVKKAKNVLSSVLASISGRAYTYFTLCCQMVPSIIGCLSQRFSKNSFSRERSARYVKSTNYNCGIVLVIGLAFILLIWLSGVKGKYCKGKDKNFYKGEYLFTVDWAHPESNILNTEHSEIPQEHKCAHILALANGNYAAQPNNRILWHVNNYTTESELARL